MLKRFSQLMVKFLPALLVGLGCFCVIAQSTPSIQAIVSAINEARYKDALYMTDQLLRRQPDSAQLWALKATALERTDEEASALAAYQHALHLSPQYLPALEGAAQIEYKSQSPGAMPLLHRIVSLQPTNQVAHAMLAVMEYRAKQYSVAAQDFASAGSILDTQPESLIEWAISLARLNRHADAIQKLQKLLTMRPASNTVRYDLALEQWRSSAPTDALATLQPLLSAQPVDVPALRLAAAIHEFLNDTPQALDLLRSAILANPDDEANYLDFATLSFMHRSYSVGVDILSAGLKKLPNSADLYIARGVLYGQNGDFEKAMDDFEHAHRIDPVYSMAASAEGIALSERHDHPAAIEEFRLEIQEHPNNAIGYYLLAEALSWVPADGSQSNSSNSSHEAIAMAIKATQLDPHLREAWDLLGSLLLDAGEAKRAESACRTALAIDPNDQQAIYTLLLASRKTASQEELRQLVQRLTEVRKQAEIADSHSKHYGRLVEEP